MKTPKPAPAKMVSHPIFRGAALSRAQVAFQLQNLAFNRTLHNFIEVTHGAARLRSVDSPQMQQSAAFADGNKDLRF